MARLLLRRSPMDIDGHNFALFPRVSRFVVSLFSAVAVADYLQFAYEKAKSASGQAPSS